MIYRGRLAPSPTGYLHLGHGKTFMATYQRAVHANGELVLRIEDLDPLRCKSEYVDAIFEDFKWLGISWSGEPVFQSRRKNFYLECWKKLKEMHLIYPCSKSRKDVRMAANAPHEEEDEPIFPIAWRPSAVMADSYVVPAGINWRFRVPDGRTISFVDEEKGEQSFVAGKDFGDFLVWRKDDVPAYELAVVVDDMAMGITEVVRGEDLLKSTARQYLIYEALHASPPGFCHLPLLRDLQGRRLAKRDDALSLNSLRQRGLIPDMFLNPEKKGLSNEGYCIR